MLAKIPWAALALLHVMPALALFRPSSMTSLYGIAADSPLMPLMQHLAALFLCILVAAVWAMFDPGARRLAVVVIAISMLSFLALYVLAGQPANLRSIALADLLCVPFLIWAAYLAFGAST